jgi:lipopolysaccharide biosynthesis regulator YciM
MPYILRNESGKIFKASARTLVGAELLPHNHPDVLEFLKLRGQDPQQVEIALGELRRTDGEMARAVEDVIMVLLKKNLFKMSDLPKPVQDRMSFRVRQRVLIQDIYDQATARNIS